MAQKSKKKKRKVPGYYLQSLRSFVFVATILAFVFFRIGMHDHVHFESPFCIQLEATVWANVCRVLMNIFMCSQSGHILELLWTMRALKGEFLTVRYLMLFQCTFRDKTLPTFFAYERSVSRMNRSYVSLSIH